MPLMWRRAWLVALAVVLLAGCGGDDPPAPVASLLFDCSRFRDLADEYVPELVDLAVAVGRERQVLQYSCVDGSPLTTTHLRTVHFDEPLGGEGETGVPQDPERIVARNARWAHSLRERFREMIATGRERRWSGLLEGLLLPAEQPRVRTIWFWTDGEIRDPATDFSLPSASPQRMREEIDAWVHRLHGLRNKTLVVIGGGRDVLNEPTAIKARQFFHTLVVDRIRGRLVWILSLDEVEPSRLLS